MTAPTPAETAAFLRARERADAATIRWRHDAVVARLPAVAALLRERFGATTIWLFGSHAAGRLHLESDVDLAVEGLSGAVIDRATAAVEEVLGGGVDLVALEGAPPTLQHRVRAEGILL